MWPKFYIFYNFILPYVNNETATFCTSTTLLFGLCSRMPHSKNTSLLWELEFERASRTENTDCVQRADWRWSWTRGTAQCSGTGTGSGSAQCNSGSGLGTAALQGYCTHTADSGDGHRTGDKTQAVVHTDMEGGSPTNETDKSGWLDFISNSQKNDPQQCFFCFVHLGNI